MTINRDKSMSYFRGLPIDISTQADQVVFHSGEYKGGNYCRLLEAMCESGQLVIREWISVFCTIGQIVCTRYFAHDTAGCRPTLY